MQKSNTPWSLNMIFISSAQMRNRSFTLCMKLYFSLAVMARNKNG